MKVLVTGGAGFIGGAMARHLINEGAEVIIVDDLSGGSMRIMEGSKKGTYELFPKKVQDLGSVKEWERSFDPSGIDWVLHFAGHYANVHSLEEPIKNVDTNMVGTMAVLDFCRRYKIRNLMYASSSGVYGALDSVAYAENAPPRPSTPYECTKYSGELLCCGYGEIYKISIVAPRFFNVYGKGDVPGKWRAVVPNFFKAAFEGRALRITGENVSRDFTYIDDVVNAVLSGMERAEQAPHPINLVYNIATGREVFIKNLAEIIRKAVRSESEIIEEERRFWDNAPRRVGDVHKFASLFPADAANMRPIEEGIESSIDWYSTVCK